MSAHNYLLDINNLRVFQPNKHTLDKLQSRTIALSAISIISTSLDKPLFGARDPPRMGDAIVKLFGRRLRVDEVTLALARKLGKGEATKEETNWFRSLVVCFDGMVERDVKRARRRISREPMLTDKAKELMKRMVWHSNFWERYMDLPTRSTTKGRNNSLANVLVQAMEKAEKKEKRAEEEKQQKMKIEQARKAEEADGTDSVEKAARQKRMEAERTAAEDAMYELTGEEAARWKAAGAVDDGNEVEVLVVQAERVDIDYTPQEMVAGGDSGKQNVVKSVVGNDDLDFSLSETEEAKKAAATKKRQAEGGGIHGEVETKQVGQLADSVIVDGVYIWV